MRHFAWDVQVTMPVALSGGMVRLSVVVVILAVAVVFDFRERRIPNWLVGLGFIAGLGLDAAGLGAVGLADGMVGCLVGFVLLLPFYLLRAMGAGDVKLMAVMGLLLGYPKIVIAVVCTFIAGGVLGLAITLAKRNWRELANNMADILREMLLWIWTKERPAQQGSTKSAGMMPYSFAIAVGVGLSFYWSGW